MSDRCYVKLTCLRKDREVFETMGFGEEYDDANDTGILGLIAPENIGVSKSIELIDPEAPGANYDFLADLDGKGIPFVALSGTGISFGPARYACDGNEVFVAEATFEGELHARIDDETGKINKGDVRFAIRFLRVERRALKLLGISGNSWDYGPESITIGDLR